MRETVDLYSGYFPQPRNVDEVIDVVGLARSGTTRVDKLSGGQQRRLDVAIGLAGDPELLFLDEPTTGFDPSARRNAWEMVKSLTGLGKTVFLTTHFMDEAQYLANRVAVISHGERWWPRGRRRRSAGATRCRRVHPVPRRSGDGVTADLGQVATGRRHVRDPRATIRPGAPRADRLGDGPWARASTCWR